VLIVEFTVIVKEGNILGLLETWRWLQ